MMIRSRSAAIEPLHLIRNVVNLTFVQYIELIEKTIAWSGHPALYWPEEFHASAEYREIHYWAGESKRLGDPSAYWTTVDLFGRSPDQAAILAVLAPVWADFAYKADTVISLFSDEVDRQIDAGLAPETSVLLELVEGVTCLVRLLFDLLATKVEEESGQVQVSNQTNRRPNWHPIRSVADLTELRRRFG